jgi:hypothetical protein
VPNLVSQFKELYDKDYQPNHSLTNFRLITDGEDQNMVMDYRATNGELVPALNFTKRHAELYAKELKRMKEARVKLNEPVGGLAGVF